MNAYVADVDGLGAGVGALEGLGITLGSTEEAPFGVWSDVALPTPPAPDEGPL